MKEPTEINAQYVAAVQINFAYKLWPNAASVALSAPPLPGTKKLKRIYGKKLLAVRYRYGKALVYITIELLHKKRKIKKRAKHGK